MLVLAQILWIEEFELHTHHTVQFLPLSFPTPTVTVSYLLLAIRTYCIIYVLMPFFFFKFYFPCLRKFINITLLCFFFFALPARLVEFFHSLFITMRVSALDSRHRGEIEPCVCLSVYRSN